MYKRRELATSFETRSRFPELVIQEKKRVRFVVVNGLAIVERPTSMHIDDIEWYMRIMTFFLLLCNFINVSNAHQSLWLIFY